MKRYITGTSPAGLDSTNPRLSGLSPYRWSTRTTETQVAHDWAAALLSQPPHSFPPVGGAGLLVMRGAVLSSTLVNVLFAGLRGAQPPAGGLLDATFSATLVSLQIIHNVSLSPYVLVAWGTISRSQLMCTSDPIWRKRLTHGSSVHILSGSWWYTRRSSHSTCPVSGHPPVRTTILTPKELQFGENGTTYGKQASRMASDIPKAAGMMKLRWRL